MKKIGLSLLVIFALVFTSCSSDDDGSGGGSQNEELKMTVNGAEKTFNTVIVNDQNNSTGDGYIQVTATIGTQTNEIISFYANQGASGSTAIDTFTYMVDGVEYSAGSTGGSGIPNNYINSLVSTNDGSTFTATFSGVFLGPYDVSTDTYETLEFSNGRIHVTY
ncbi:hypothetical protein ACFS5M_10210 [Lacinutrix iliipiscaria]|uniref:DUF4352 domain-containing protein n=1 Tax=Lacinutrix iliipiscaria TaxID=1230532 RepID=A0ABW5WRH5_9FLAO